jgi:tetratricopeptide (TPR) repeat protein
MFVMSLDPYQPCPCGSGKKVKFCCVKDLSSEVDKIMRLIEAEQRIAALEHTRRLVKTKGPREALLVLEATVELQLGEIEKASRTVAKLRAEHPNNPSGHALQAIIAASLGSPREAIGHLQRAIALSEEPWSEILIDGIDIVSRALMAVGDIPAARGHLLLLGDVGSDEAAERAVNSLMQIGLSGNVPLLLKQELTFDDIPDDAPWRGAFEEAMGKASYGAWQEAVEELEKLAAAHPEVTAIPKSIAHVRGWLGDAQATAAAWRKYAAIDSLPLEERVEAEAMALLLEPPDESLLIDQHRLTFPVGDASALLEQLASNRRLVSITVDRHDYPDDQPPRDRIESGESADSDQLPHILASLALFGKQTDRDARLEVVDFKTSQEELVKTQVADLLGALAGGEVQQQVVGRILDSDEQQTRVWTPPDTPHKRRVEIERELMRRDILDRWADQPQARLGGKTPRQAAQEPGGQVRVLALLLLLEISMDATSMFAGRVDFNDLRRQIGLPTLGPIKSSEVPDVRKLPLARMARLDVESLSDYDLVALYYRASRVSATAALRKICAEVVRRESLDEHEQIAKEVAYRTLAALWMHDKPKVVEYVEQGKRYAVRHGRSPAQFLLADLQFAVAQGDAQRFEKNVQELQNRHLNEPGVREQLVSILMKLGLLRPDGSLNVPRSPTGGATAPSEAAAAPEQKVWTPGGQASPQPGGEKSKLWVPGMD